MALKRFSLRAHRAKQLAVIRRSFAASGAQSVTYTILAQCFSGLKPKGYWFKQLCNRFDYIVHSPNISRFYRSAATNKVVSI